jgi:hypothetical protein
MRYQRRQAFYYRTYDNNADGIGMMEMLELMQKGMRCSQLLKICYLFGGLHVSTINCGEQLYEKYTAEDVQRVFTDVDSNHNSR